MLSLFFHVLTSPFLYSPQIIEYSLTLLQWYVDSIPVLSLPQSEGNTDSVLGRVSCPNLVVCRMDSLVPSCSQYI